MKNKTEESRHNYNKKAKYYEEDFEGRFTLPYNEYIRDHSGVRDGLDVLDVACGNGRLIGMLSDRAAIRAYGLDVSEEMIRVAAAAHPDIRFQVGSADILPFGDSSMDLVTVCCAFHHFEHPSVFMSEAHRILRTRGVLLIAEPCLPPVLRQIENLFIPFFRMGDVKTYGRRQLERFFRNAGFNQIAVVRDGIRLYIEGRKK